MSEASATFEALGRELARQLGGPSLEEHVESAEAKLEDDDLVAFALVAIREDEDGRQGATQRVVDPEAAVDAADTEAYIDALHDQLVALFDEEVAER